MGRNFCFDILYGKYELQLHRGDAFYRKRMVSKAAFETTSKGER
jgi:hypothetical protein